MTALTDGYSKSDFMSFSCFLPSAESGTSGASASGAFRSSSRYLTAARRSGVISGRFGQMGLPFSSNVSSHFFFSFCMVKFDIVITYKGNPSLIIGFLSMLHN